MNGKHILAGTAAAGTIGLGGWLIWSHSTVQQDIKEEKKAPEVPKKTYPGAMTKTTKESYQANSLGAKFSDYLLDVKVGAEKEWNDKYNELKKNQPASGLFKIAQKNNTNQQLKTTCEQMFTYNKEVWGNFKSGGVETNEQRKILWEETWNYCAAASKNEMPNDWPSNKL